MSIEQDLRAVSDQIERIVDAIAAGMPYASLKIRMEELETRRAELEARQAALGAHEAPIRLHPGLTKAYAAKVSELSHALNDPALRTEAVEILRGLVSEIRMVPQPDGRHEIELSGDLAAILALANGENAKARLGAGPAETMVAGAGFEPAAFRL